MEILYVCPDFVACVKPVGLDSETEFPAALREALGGTLFPIHRLDRNVAGVMVYARTKAAAAALSRVVQEGTLVKEYVAMVHGTPPECGDWSDFLFKDSRANKVFVVKKERKGVKAARLEFRRLSAGKTSLVRIRLHTGRTHQIRVQFSSRGFPLVGASVSIFFWFSTASSERDAASVPMLYSCRITVPWKGKAMVFESLPDWAQNC